MALVITSKGKRLMLEGLDQVNWSCLTHAYGNAEDVPGLLRARGSVNPDEAREAEYDLFGNIWHQGTVYEATAYTVPFLVELLQRVETQERAGLVMLLAAIAEGHSFLEVHGSLPHYAKDKDTPGFSAELAKEMEWKAKAHAAVQEHAECYWRLLADTEVRASIPYLLSKLPAESQKVRTRFPVLIAEGGEGTYGASLLFCLAFASRGITPSPSPFPAFLGSNNPLFRLGGALGILFGDASESVDDALHIFVEALKDSGPFQPKEMEWLWGSGELHGMLLECIPQFRPPAQDALRATLPEVLPALDKWEASSLAAAAMHLGFAEENLPRSKEQLTGLQLALLVALARTTNVAYMDPLILGIQEALGLPHEMEALARFLKNEAAKGPKGGCSTPQSGRPWWRFW